RYCSRNFAEQSRVPVSIRARQFEKEFAPCMNDFSEFEDKLRKLRPVPPSADLMTRVERALAEARPGESLHREKGSTSTAGVLPREHRFHFNWVSLGLGLAAAAALVLFARFQLELPVKKAPALASNTPIQKFSSKNSTEQFVPVGLNMVVYHYRDEGYLYLKHS